MVKRKVLVLLFISAIFAIFLSATSLCHAATETTSQFTYSSNKPIGCTEANVIVGGVKVGNAVESNGKTTGNLTDIAKGLGLNQPVYNKGTNSTALTINAKAITFDCSKPQGMATDGTLYTIFIGKIQVGIRDMANKLGVGSTVSYYHDSKGTNQVLVQPEMKIAPVQVTRAEDNINIKAYVNFTKDANKYFPGTGTYAMGGYVNQKTYAEVAAESITKNWNTNFVGTWYDFGYGKKINTNMIIYSKSYSPNGILRSTNISDGQRFMDINIDWKSNGRSYQDDMTVPSAVIDAVTGDWYFSNWATRNVGNVNLYKTACDIDTTEIQFGLIASHEFGHVLGLGDAYGEGKRPDADITREVPEDDLMRNSWTGKLTCNDVEMVWEAWETNKYQSFTTWNSSPFGISPYGQYTKSDVIRTY